MKHLKNLDRSVEVPTHIQQSHKHNQAGQAIYRSARGLEKRELVLKSSHEQLAPF